MTEDVKKYGLKLAAFKIFLDLGCERDAIFANFIPQRTYYDCLNKLEKQVCVEFKEYVKAIHKYKK